MSKFSHKGVDWDSQPLGEVSDTVLAGRLGVDRSAVGSARYVRGIPACDRGYVDWDSQPLGEVHDSELARRLGVAEGAVNAARKRRGISAKKRERVWDKDRGKHWRWIDWDKQPLGVVSDAELANAIGCDRHTVLEARKKRGIPKVKIMARCPCGTEFEARTTAERYCSKGCQVAVCHYNWEHGRDEGMEKIVASMSRLRREVKKRR